MQRSMYLGGPSRYFAGGSADADTGAADTGAKVATTQRPVSPKNTVTTMGTVAPTAGKAADGTKNPQTGTGTGTGTSTNNTGGTKTDPKPTVGTMPRNELNQKTMAVQLTQNMPVRPDNRAASMQATVALPVSINQPVGGPVPQNVKAEGKAAPAKTEKERKEEEKEKEKEKGGKEKEKEEKKEKPKTEKAGGAENAEKCADKQIGNSQKKKGEEKALESPVPAAGSSGVVKKIRKEGYFKKGTLVLNRYEVSELVSWGGFGEVYSAIDTSTKELVAVKVDTGTEIRRTKLEIEVMIQLRGTPNFPEILAYGKVSEHALIVVQLLGRNLMELRVQRQNKKFTAATVYRIAKQLFSALRALHAEGFVHRDVKPANCCIGRLDSSRIYLLDFGMVRIYRDAHGNKRKPRNSTGFRGTHKYAAVSAQLRKEQGSYSDLQSLVYTLVELSEGSLPWAQSKAPARVLKDYAQMLRIKKETSVKALCRGQPEAFHQIAKYVLGLTYDDEPDYDQIDRLVDKCIPPGIDANSYYDWEVKEVKEKECPPPLQPQPTVITAKKDEKQPQLIVFNE